LFSELQVKNRPIYNLRLIVSKGLTCKVKSIFIRKGVSLMRNRIIQLSLTGLLLLMIFYVIGCSGSAGVSNGAIKGRITTTDGNDLPQVKIRVEGRDEDMPDNNPYSRYVVVDNSDGMFVVPDVPVGVYTITAYAVGYEMTGTEGQVSASGATTELALDAIIENGKTYELPTIYVKKRSSNQPGSVKGTVYDRALLVPLNSATVSIGGFSVNTDSNGEYEIGGLIPQDTPQTVDCIASGFKQYSTSPPDSVSTSVYIVPGKEVIYDVYLTRGDGEFNITVAPSAADPFPSWIGGETFTISFDYGTTSVTIPEGQQAGTVSFTEIPMGKELTYRFTASNSNYNAVSQTYNNGTLPGFKYSMLIPVIRKSKNITFTVHADDQVNGAISVQVINVGGVSREFGGANVTTMSAITVPYGTILVSTQGATGLKTTDAIAVDANLTDVEEIAFVISDSSPNTFDIYLPAD
jgi:hypothetical protein